MIGRAVYKFSFYKSSGFEGENYCSFHLLPN